MSTYQVGDKFIIEIVDVIHRKSERYGDETVSYVVDQMDAFEFEDVDLDRLELYEQADTPQTEKIKTRDYCDICNHEGCDNCVANSLDDYCVPSNYAPKDIPRTDFVEDDKCFDCEDFFTCDEHQTDCGWK